MASWFKRHKNGRTTYTTRACKGTTTSTSTGNKKRKVTTTTRPNGSIVRTITERSAGMTRRTSKTIQKKRK